MTYDELFDIYDINTEDRVALRAFVVAFFGCDED